MCVSGEGQPGPSGEGTEAGFGGGGLQGAQQKDEKVSVSASAALGHLPTRAEQGLTRPSQRALGRPWGGDALSLGLET